MGASPRSASKMLGFEPIDQTLANSFRIRRHRSHVSSTRCRTNASNSPRTIARTQSLTVSAGSRAGLSFARLGPRTQRPLSLDVAYPLGFQTAAGKFARSRIRCRGVCEHHVKENPHGVAGPISHSTLRLPFRALDNAGDDPPIHHSVENDTYTCKPGF